MRTEFIIGNTLCVVRLGFTSNDKIAPASQKIVQTYHYSRDQFEDAQSKSSMQSFFSKDGDVCFDCPYSMGSGGPGTRVTVHQRPAILVVEKTQQGRA